ncbi:hypothetical protein KP509_37G053300 [Ceratopteris richardii]|uniref:Uncharacterized protein n=1 Tax=Ceratopteris richardii TaxID=49495 RepID=A0A8T2Q9A3_CERRI|nr:hypothetical protein KP509_37G053300 [Ceratopteris richardii]
MSSTSGSGHGDDAGSVNSFHIGGSHPPVQVVSRELVSPASPSPSDPFFLSCFDIPWQDFHYNRRLLFYKNPSRQSARESYSDVHASSLVQSLKCSLSLCLVHYYCWSGRLSKGIDPPHRLFIDCNDAGVEFVEAFIDMPLSLFVQDGFQMKPVFNELCQTPDHRGDRLFSSPLLSIQVTLFSDGGLAVGVSQSHVVADGQALWDFMVSWGECSRSVSLSKPPSHDRQRLAVPNPSLEKAQRWVFFPDLSPDDEVTLREEAGREAMGPSKAVGKGTPSETKHSAPVDTQKRDRHIHEHEVPDFIAGLKDDVVQWVFTLSASALKKLKSEAGEGFTSFEVMCAHFWQRFCLARNDLPGTCTSFFIPINCRTLLKPPLPPAYFGNVIGSRVVASVASKIREESLAAIASRIHSELAAFKREHMVESLMHWLETHENRIVPTLMSAPPRPPTKGLNVASSPWFPAYEVDFGWGKPDAVRAAKVPGEGEMILFGGRPGSIRGDLEICTALPQFVLQSLLQDPLFLGVSPCPSDSD